jgi:hypothetical protein
MGHEELPAQFDAELPAAGDGRAGALLLRLLRPLPEIESHPPPPVQRAAGRVKEASNGHLGGSGMIVFGVILMIIGFLAGIAPLWTIGLILVIVGLVLSILGMAGRSVGGRRTYY